jgi:cholesterol transport system auxiliary component
MKMPRLPLLLVCGLAPLLAACVSLKVGSEASPQAQFRIVDAAPAPAPAARTNGRDLVIAAQPSPALDDSFSLTFSRTAGQRAAYQFATWSERPSSRMAQLLVDRLAARRAFNSVALAGRGIAGDMLLNLTIADFYHDASATPGSARVEVSAELIDRSNRKLVARRTFSATAPVAQANAAGAAAALSEASSRVVGEIAAWAEAAAAPAAMAAR